MTLYLFKPKSISRATGAATTTMRMRDDDDDEDDGDCNEGSHII